jgi:hypothetical protein
VFKPRLTSGFIGMKEARSQPLASICMPAAYCHRPPHRADPRNPQPMPRAICGTAPRPMDRGTIAGKLGHGAKMLLQPIMAQKFKG